MNAYELTDVRFSYGGRPVLDVPELEIPRAGVTALIGPNGSGKSTLLHLLGFWDEPRGGALRFFGEAAGRDRFASLRLRVSVLLQNPYLFHASVAGNVEWGLKIRGMPTGQRKHRAGEALELVGLSAYAARPAAALSGGEAQRLALARLLALEPEVLLLDEPTNHVDVDTRERIEATLARWVCERGSTVVLATHDAAQAHRLGAGVWRLSEGRMRKGEPENVFRGRLCENQPYVFDTGKVRLTVHTDKPDVTCLRISSREVILSRVPPTTSARNCLSGTIVKVELEANDVVRVTLDCGEAVVAVLTRESWVKLGFTVGGKATASFKASALQPC